MMKLMVLLGELSAKRGELWERIGFDDTVLLTEGRMQGRRGSNALPEKGARTKDDDEDEHDFELPIRFASDPSLA
jgi:hypothetical protein